MGKRQKETERKCYVQILRVVQGAGLIIVLSGILVFLAAWMVGHGMIAEENSDWIIRIICFISPLLVSIFRRKITGGCAVAEGILSALFAGAFLAGFGMIVWGEFSVGKGAWNILLFVFGGSLFGILTRNKKKRRRN